MLTWTAHLKGAPESIYHVAVAVGLDMYSFGGFCKNKVMGQNEVHIFNTASLNWKQLPRVTAALGKHPPVVPSIDEGYTAELIGDAVYVWGGYSYKSIECKYNNVLYVFDVDKHLWFKPKVSGTVPNARGNHSACVLGMAMYVYGGITRLKGPTNKIYTLDTTTMVWSSINAAGTPPPASSLQSSSVIGTKVFVFGGLGEEGAVYSNISVFESNRWLKTPTAEILPEGRFGHSAFTYNGQLYIFGGSNWNNTLSFNDLWKFNPEAFSWRKVEPKGKGPLRRPPGKCWMCCCVVGDRVVLFNKYDLYILDLDRPSLKTLCKLSVIQYGLKQSGLPHNIRWEMAAMTNIAKKNGKPTIGGKTGKGGNRR